MRVQQLLCTNKLWYEKRRLTHFYVAHSCLAFSQGARGNPENTTQASGYDINRH